MSDKKVFNIGIELDADFVDCLNGLIEKYGPELAKLNGFAPEQLNYTDFIDNFIDKKTVADASIDGNANVRDKDIVTLMNEMSKPHQKLLSFNKIFYEMKKKWGKEAAIAFLEKEYVGIYYLHDAYSASFVGYCYAADVDKVAKEGLFFFNNGSHAPQHLVTFTDFVCETVSYAENRSAGAFGLPSFLVWSFYFWHKDVENGYYIKTPEYYRDQEFQRVIYKLNQPYLRSGIQSAFTNFNIFDHPYFEALFGGVEFPDGTYAIDFEDEIIEYQKAFMEVVSKTRQESMFTFPVLTYSLLRQNGKFVDEEFARWACEHNMKWADSNFYISDSVDSLSSCCFTGDTLVCYKDFDGRERYSSLFAIYDTTQKNEYVKTFDGKEWVEAKPIRLPLGKHTMYRICLTNGAIVVATDNHLFPTERGDIRADELTTSDKILYTYHADFYYCCIESIEEYKYDEKYVYCFEMKNQEYPYFMLANGIITHNCRLRNAIKGEDTPYFNSIGGTALNVGSVKVNTINLARLAYLAEDNTEQYLQNVYNATYDALKVLDVQRHIIERNIEKGLLPNYTSGLIDITKQYSTIGCVAGAEAIEHFGLTQIDEFGNFSYTDEGLTLYKNALAKIHEAIDAFKKDNNIQYMVNLEQVPAERAAAILMEKDQIFYPNEKYSLPLYGNQWIPLAQKATLKDRTITCGVLDNACNGGSIEHINVDAPFNNFETAWYMLNWVADQGVTYFAFCTRISACENNHGFYGNVCPICGKPVDTTYQRVAGFLTPVKSYSKERKAEFAKRDWMDLNAMEDLQ